jgi:thiosulfate/3-mercaptopyruvate sulfurtransferase
MRQTGSHFLVSTEWLASHAAAPDIVVVDVRLPPVGMQPKPSARALYEAGHIPDAVFFDIDTIADTTSDLPHMLPLPEVFSTLAGQLGIGNHMRVVVYEDDGVFSAPRVWWTFRTFGVRDVFILDGGLKQWKEEGRSIQSGMVIRQPANFSAQFDSLAVKSFDQMLSALSDGATQVIDARSAARFNGTAPEPRPGLRTGHIPGSINIPYTDLAHDGRLRPTDELRKIFANKRIDLDRPIVTSCGSGVTAAVLTLGLEMIGAKQVSLYDGSWTEWGGRPDTPIEAGCGDC